MTKKRGLFRRLLGHIIFLLTILAAGWMGLCYAASVTSPERLRFLALMSLTTPFAIVVNVFFLFFWLFSAAKWRALLPLLTLALTFSIVRSVFGLHLFEQNNMDAGRYRIKVMTWNVHGLGIYDRPVDPTVPDQMFDLIKNEEPDILCLPEFYTDWDNALRPHAARFKRLGGYREYRFIYDNTLGTKIYVGTAFFSKYPLSNMRSIRLSRNIHMMQCDVELPAGRMMRTCFIHLQSFLLQDKDKQWIEQIENEKEDVVVAKSKGFIRRFDDAYRKRAQQADSAAAIISRSPYPVLICGDFNDLPGSYTYTTMKGKLRDAFAEQGLGIGRTYNAISPTLRIDYIFYDPSLLRIIGFRSPRVSISDHNPVIANFELRP